jgi:hypothetical protein
MRFTVCYIRMLKFPISLDCIEDGNYKMALNYANKVLKKRHDAIAEALKALCHLRLNEPKEAEEICDRLNRSLDEHVLHIVSIVYSSLRQRMITTCIILIFIPPDDKIVQMYENAMNATSANDQFAQLHFFASLRRELNPTVLQKVRYTAERVENHFYSWL